VYKRQRYVRSSAPKFRGINLGLDKELRLDDLDIKWHTDEKGIKVPCGQGQTVTVLHGHEIKKSGKMPGTTAQEFAVRLGTNVHIGHTHKLGLQSWFMGGKQLFAVEGGHLSDTNHPALKYAGLAPNWTHGFSMYDGENRNSRYPRFFTP